MIADPHEGRPACSRCVRLGACPTPQACEMAEPPRERPHRRDFWRVALLLIGTWAATGLTLLALVKR